MKARYNRNRHSYKEAGSLPGLPLARTKRRQLALPPSILKSYLGYYHRTRTHLSLVKDAPEPRVVQPAEGGEVFEIAEVGGLHHRYERKAA